MSDLDFSLIIPVALDRPAEVVESIKRLDYPKDRYEVIIEKGTNPSANRNAGIKKSKGKILAFLDDDAILPMNLLNNVNHFFQKYPHIEIVGGPQLTPPDDPFFSKVSGYALSSFFGGYFMSIRYKKHKINLNADEASLTSAICFIKTGVFNKINGFDASLFPGEDPEFFARAKKNNVKIAYSPDIHIYHRRRPTYILFFKQIFNYGVSRISKERRSKTKTRPVYFMPAIFTIYLVSLPVLFVLSQFFIIPLIIYIMLAIFFSIPSFFKNPLSVFAVPFLIFTMHIAYGLGIIKGIFKK